MYQNKIIQEDLKSISDSKINWHQLEGKTVLITGANGFLPAYMLDALLYLSENKIIENIDIIALIRNEEKATKRFKNHLTNKSLRFIVQDVCDLIEIDKPIHFIIHAASQASPKYYGIDPVGTLKANVAGTLNLCELAKKNPVESFLYFSSGEVYGKVSEDISSITELDYGYLDPMNVRSCYGESKRMGETICVSYLQQYGLPVRIVRPAHTYGPGMDLNDGRVFADFVRDIINYQNITMHSDGSASRAFCYLSDAVIAFFKVLLEGEIGNAYNVANPYCEITILELAEKLVNLFPERNLKVVKKQGIATSNGYIASLNIRNRLNVNKINKLNWTPTTSIEEGFRKTVLSYE